jgi:cysteine synthase
MPARYILDQAEARGELKPGAHIVETTSGTFGMAVALLAAARGYALMLVTASSLIDAKYKARLERIGATVIAIDDPRGDGNQPGRLECLQTILTSDPECFWTRQYDSSENWLAYARLAEFLVRAMGKVDCLVGCIGTGGSLCGTGTFLRTLFPDLKIFAVDTQRSILFGQPVGKRMLRGLGNSVLPANVRHELIDEIHWVGAYPAYMTAHRLLRLHGYFKVRPVARPPSSHSGLQRPIPMRRWRRSCQTKGIVTPIRSTTIYGLLPYPVGLARNLPPRRCFPGSGRVLNPTGRDFRGNDEASTKSWRRNRSCREIRRSARGIEMSKRDAPGGTGSAIRSSSGGSCRAPVHCWDTDSRRRFAAA